MGDGATAVECGSCGHSFAEPKVVMQAPRHPCPDCGATARTVHLHASDTVSVHESVALKGLPAEGGRWFIHLVQDKLEWFRKLGRWHLVTRVIDRRNDQYDEVITDHETGAVVREVHELLSQHQGRGSARRP